MKRGIAFLILAFVIQIVSNNCDAQSDFEKIKKRTVSELMKSAVNDAEIEILVNTIRDDGTWPGINYQDVSRTGFEHRIHTSNMVELARAYKKSGSKYNKSKKVKSTIELALKNWVDNDYFCDNWWHNQIGTPTSLVSLMLIMGDELPKDLVEKAQPIIGRANLNASGARPSGDRIKIAGILAHNLLFIKDIEQFEEVIKVIEGEIKFTTGRGMQYDYSFHHRVDRVNNTLSYGTGYADAFIEWAVYVTGTKYAFSTEKLNQLIDYYLDGICKTMVFGKYPDFGAKNRSISREGALNPSGAGAPEKLLQTTSYRRDELQEIADIREKSVKPTLSHATFYWQSEHFTFQRPDFYTSVRMYSTRNDNMEQPYNSEGLLNHHRGDGTNHLSITGKEYYDIAPVFDYQKVPGATIVQKPLLPSENEIQKTGLTDFVGAVTDGLYGAVAFDFRSPHDPLAAKKAWFFFDDEYVCLGAGISSESRLNVATAINQCLLNGDVVVMKDDTKSILALGEHNLKNVKWILHGGVGYIFPDPVSVNLDNQKVSGSWYTINHQSDSPKDEITKDVFKLWFDHGSQPDNASYQYIVVPAVSEQEIIDGNSSRNIEILVNTPEVQAVKHSGLNITQIVFYRAGEVRISSGLKLTSDGPGLVMVKCAGDEIKKISVSDPSRKLSKIHISVSAKISGSGRDYEAVWSESLGVSNLSISLPIDNYAGKSVIIDLNSQQDRKLIEIDETNKAETIVQTIKIDKVWAGQPVGFCLLTNGNRQYIAYYNASRNMVVGQRNLEEEKFSLHVMPATYRESNAGTSTVLGWDSHNSVTMAIDKDGFIHLAGNMHANPLTYYRSKKPGDISTLEQVMHMIGTNEERCTYPHFANTREGELIFHYRDGGSGNGNEIYNIYSCESKLWSRLLDTPLTDGQGLMNAYQSQPAILADNWYHVYWVWRDTPDCSTNHDLSYMKSRDLKHWFNAFGEPVELPATLDERMLIVDPIPVNGGIINLAARLCLDENMKPLFAYHKYDEKGMLQFYVAHTENGKWISKQITDWDYRWEFSGSGSINFEVTINNFKRRDDGYYEIGFSHIKYGNGTILLNSNLENIGKVIKPKPNSNLLNVEGNFPGLLVQTSGDIGIRKDPEVKYVLKWETLPRNRDDERPEPWPEASQLYLFKLLVK